MIKMYSEQGGILSIESLRLTPLEVDELLSVFKKIAEIYNHPLLKMYEDFIESQSYPLFNADIHEDLPCRYLGYNRRGKTKLWVKLKECWRILWDKPSHAYFTDENGEEATGLWKEGYRITLNHKRVQELAEIAFNCRNNPEYYVIPIIPFIPSSINIPIKWYLESQHLTAFWLPITTKEIVGNE